jgi:hypothetical protein
MSSPALQRKVSPCLGIVLVLLALAGCGTSWPRTTARQQPALPQARLPVYNAGKLLGYCHGQLVHKGRSIAFETRFLHGSHEALICAQNAIGPVHSELYKASASSRGLAGARILRLQSAQASTGVKRAGISVYSTTAKLLGFCTPGKGGTGTGNLVCTTPEHQLQAYTLQGRPLGTCTPDDPVSGVGKLVCIEEVPSDDHGQAST